MTVAMILSLLGPILEQLVAPISQAILSFIESFYSAKDPSRLAELIKQTVESMAELAVPGDDKRRQALADITGAVQADASYIEGIAADEVTFVINSLLEKFALATFKQKKAAA